MLINNKLYEKSLTYLTNDLTITKGTFLITGASGLIGSCLIDSLMFSNKHKGTKFKVYAISRNKERVMKRFAYVDDLNQLEIIEQDICTPISLSIGVDYVIHAASNADPRTYSLQPAETLLINIEGTKNVLEYCRNHVGTRILLTSTFEVYGCLNGKDEYSEDTNGITNINQIRSCYPESKRCAEILLRCYRDEYNVDGVIARLCSVYGPTMLAGDSKAHSQFLKNGLNGENIILKSAGSQRRTYAYVIDVISGIFKVLLRGKSGEAYNIANENSIATIAEVAKTVAVVAGTKVVFSNPDEVEKIGFSNPQNCILKNDKLKRLGWQGRYSLKDGLEETFIILKNLEE